MYNDFTPDYNFTGTSTLSPFEVWCQKVLPTIYDNSLSYYELLTKVVKYLNDTMSNVNDLQKDVTELNKAYNQLVTYVNAFKDYSENRMDNQDEAIANLTTAWNKFQEEMQKAIDDIPNQVINAVDEYTETQAFTTKVKVAVDQSLQEAGAIPEISEINTKIGTSTDTNTIFQDLEEIKEDVSNISISGVDDVNAKIGSTTDSQASATDGSVMGKLNLLIKSGSGSSSTDVNVQAITDNIGSTTDSGATATSGTVFGKLNKIITDIANSVVSKLTEIATNVTSINSKTDTINTDVSEINTKSGTINTNVNAVNTNLTSVNSKIGTTADGGATATTGSVMGKSNKIIENTNTLLTTVGQISENTNTIIQDIGNAGSSVWGNDAAFKNYITSDVYSSGTKKFTITGKGYFYMTCNSTPESTTTISIDGNALTLSTMSLNVSQNSSRCYYFNKSLSVSNNTDNRFYFVVFYQGTLT